MARIKGWIKFGFSKEFRYENRYGNQLKQLYIIKEHFPTFPDRIDKSYRVVIINGLTNPIYQSKEYTKQGAITFAMKYMKSHPRG